MKPNVNPRTMRRTFVKGLFAELRVVWPILSGLLATIAGLCLVIGLIEGWSVQESIYFAFVSGLTIGYGDFAPRRFAPRVLAIGIGICCAKAIARNCSAHDRVRAPALPE